MDFFQRIGNLFSGQGWSSDKEVRKRRRREAQQPQISRQPTQNRIQNQVQNAFGLPSKPREDRRPDGMPTTSLDMSKIDRPKEPARSELDKITQDNLAKARKESARGQNWAERMLNTESNEKRAQVIARNRAISQQQEKRNWATPTPEISKFSSETARLADRNVKDARKGTAVDFLENEMAKPFRRNVKTFAESPYSLINPAETIKTGIQGARLMLDKDATDAEKSKFMQKVDPVRDAAARVQLLTDLYGGGKVAKTGGKILANPLKQAAQVSLQQAKHGAKLGAGLGGSYMGAEEFSQKGIKGDPIKAAQDAIMGIVGGATIGGGGGAALPAMGKITKVAVRGIKGLDNQLREAAERELRPGKPPQSGQPTLETPTNSPKINTSKPENRLGAGISKVEPPAGSTRVRAGENAVEQAQQPPVQPRAAEVPVRQPEQPVVTPDTNIQVQNKVPEQQPINQQNLEQDIKKTLEDLAVKADAPKQVEVPKQGAAAKVAEKPKADEMVIPQKVDTEPGQVAPIQTKDPQAIKTQEAIESMVTQPPAPKPKADTTAALKQEARSKYFKNETELGQLNRILKNEDSVAGGEKIADYYRRAKGEDWNIVTMSPDEYLQRAKKALGEEYDVNIVKGGDVDKYAKMMQDGVKFDMPYLNEVAGTQEGRTRALAAKKLGEKEIPVAVATKPTQTPARVQQVADPLKSLKQEADPVVNPKTGETLSQSVKKLEGYGWAKKDIDAYKKRMLGKTKAPVNDPNVISNMNPSGGVLVDYTPQSRMKAKLADNIATIDKTMGGNPDDMITIYRGAPKSQKNIAPGDFITTNRELAQSYTGDGNVIEMKVRKSDVLDDSSEPLGEEYIYRPATQSQPPKPAKNAKQDSPKSIEIPRPPAAKTTNTAKAPSRANAKKQSNNKQLTKKQISDRIITGVNHADDVARQVRHALGLPDSTDMKMKEVLETAGVGPKSAEKINAHFKKVQHHDAVYNKIQESSRKSYSSGEKLSKDAAKKISRKRNKALSDSLSSLSAILKETRFAAKKGDISERAVQALEDVVKYRAVNTLTSLGLLERNAAQELVSTAFRTSQNPIKMIRGSIGYGSTLKSSIKSTYRDAKNVPTGLLEKFRHGSTTLYKGGMILTESAQSKRAGMYRDEIARQALKLGGNKNPSHKEVRDLASRGGALMESVVQMYTGVDSQIVARKHALQAGDALMKFLKTGTDADYQAVSKAIENAGSVSNGLVKNLEADGRLNGKAGRALTALFNGVFMYSRVAVNAMRNSAEIFNPFTPSLVDSIGRTNRTRGQNVALGLKDAPGKAVILGAIPAMYFSGQAGYNDGDEVDQPRGVWIKTPDGKYVNSRSLGPFELPIGIMVAGSEMYKDATSGRMRDAGYYSGILTQSLPYADTSRQVSGAVDSLWSAISDTMTGDDSGTGDGGYAAKSYGVNIAKSLAPLSNNSALPYFTGGFGVIGQLVGKGNSLNAKTVYDKDPVKWLGQSVRSAYDPWFRSSLKDSRDMAGRVRTVDNQGVFINKRINDPRTRRYNADVSEAVKFARDMKIGNGTKEMFNTFNDGKNNRFKTIQGGIWAMTGKEGSNTKLKQNKKLSDLSKQIREGFYGSGDDLLTLGGDKLYSDVSMPNTRGSKNASRPINMRSIKQAIAARDLPEDKQNRLNTLGREASGLYDKAKSGEISWEERSSTLQNIAKEEKAILANSEGYKKLTKLMDGLNQRGFFEKDGLGSTRSGQTYLWNSLNALLGDKGKTPAANYPEDDKKKGWGSGRGRGRGRGGSSRSKALDTDFGMLDNMPNIQQYQTISSQAGEMPQIAVQRPRIVHKIGKSG